jgi:hypothetical protein
MTMVINQLTLNNIIIESRENDNFINATQLCKAGNKLFGHWFELKSTKELIKTLEDALKNELEISTKIQNNEEDLTIGIPIVKKSSKTLNNPISEKIKLVDIKVGKYYSGSWIHPDLAVPLAQWISPVFAIQVSRWMRELLITGSVSIESQKTNQELIELTKQLAIRDKQLEDARLGNLKLTNKILNVIPYNNNGWIYICTKDDWACKNVFRLGKTGRIDGRIKDYRMANLSDEKMYYVFKYETNNVDVLETLLRNLLIQFREDPKADQYILHWSIMEPYIKNICDIFSNQIMIATNDLISKNEEISEESIIPDKIDPDDINIDIINKINKNSQLSYYDQIILKIAKYKGAQLLTPEEEIINVDDYVTFKCEHKEWNVQLRGLLRKSSWSCYTCVGILKETLRGDDFESENYKLLISVVSKYEGAEVLTERKFIKINKDSIEIKCPHMAWHTNVEAVAILEKWRCNECKRLLSINSDNADKPLFIGGHKVYDYYKLLQETAAKYPNSQILTPKEEITKSTHRVEIQCPHKTWKTNVRAVANLGNWNCAKCNPPTRKKN